MLNVSAALKAPGQVFPLQAVIELPEMEMFDDPVRFDGVQVEGTYFSTDDNRISLKAVATAVAVSRCARCLEEASQPIRADVDALYARQSDPEDPDLYTYESSVVDLTDAVRDALVLELPMQFYCKPDCKGLCPVCGVNLNRVACTCQEGGEITNPFSALKNIVLNHEEV